MPVQHNLIYDVGLHQGEDTEFYLASGFTVVGIEADPDLVAYCKKRFAKDISDGRLILLSGAVCDGAAGEFRKFFKTTTRSVWGTVSSDRASQNTELGEQVHEIEVPVISLMDCFVRFGIPYYLKLDIEGMELHCLSQLKSCVDRPNYVSLESNPVSLLTKFEELRILSELGYTRFKLVRQDLIPGTAAPLRSADAGTSPFVFSAHSSGGFGDDARGSWHSRVLIAGVSFFIWVHYIILGERSSAFTARVLQNLRRKRNGPKAGVARAKWFCRLLTPGWHDIHASRECS